MNSCISIESAIAMDDNRIPLPVIHHETITSRREFLARAGGGFGLLALLSLMAPEAAAADWEDDQPSHPLAPRPPNFKAKAKRVIWCFLDGGPSHIDLFDPKPMLKKLEGMPLPSNFKR